MPASFTKTIGLKIGLHAALALLFASLLAVEQNAGLLSLRHFAIAQTVTQRNCLCHCLCYGKVSEAEKAWVHSTAGRMHRTQGSAPQAWEGCLLYFEMLLGGSLQADSPQAGSQNIHNKQPSPAVPEGAHPCTCGTFPLPCVLLPAHCKYQHQHPLHMSCSGMHSAVTWQRQP